jgi:hypothetical protein
VLHTRVTEHDAEQVYKVARELDRTASWVVHRLIVRGLYGPGGIRAALEGSGDGS